MTLTQQKEKIKFTTYEKIWFFSVTILAIIGTILFPEEDINGHNGKLILALYLVYTVLNVACELLIAKQSRWNFIISIFIELTEITIYVLLAYRFATMATVILFWLPIDIISFIVWTKHPDRKERELTEVRGLTGWQEVLVIVGIIVWTVGVGTLLVYVTENLTTTDLFAGRRDVEIVVCYLDALVSALDICNGTFILLRLKEQWIAWYLEVIVDAAILILSKQYFLLILTAGYLTNTTYGFIKWSRYIKTHHSEIGVKKAA